MAIEIDTSGDETIIHIQGRFMYADVYRDLRIAYESPEFANAAVKIVNLRGVNVIDSSGLAMLLEMREFFGGESANIKIMGSIPQIANILKVAGFDKLFSMG